MSGVFTQSGDSEDLLFSRSRVESALCSETKIQKADSSSLHSSSMKALSSGWY